VRRLAKGAIAGGAFTALGVAFSTAPMLASTSCDGTECDSSDAGWGCTSAAAASADPSCCKGDMPDPYTWESTPVDADAGWLDFPAFRTWSLYTAPWTGTRTPDTYLAWIAPTPPTNPYPANNSPEAPVSVSTLASGNLALWPYIGPGLVEVENGTCSPAVVRVVLKFADVDGGLTDDMLGPCWKMTHPNGMDAAPGDGGADGGG